MGYLNFFIGKSRHLSVDKNRLKIIDEHGEAFLYPLEDINSILIDSRELQLSSYLLSELASHGIVLYICDEKHLPCGFLLPNNTYFKQLKILGLQLAIAKPLKKRLWQSIIVQKITNQAKCLDIIKCGYGSKNLLNLIPQIKSGDTGNIEAVAAKRYFGFLFGDGFTRDSNAFENSALNYGYAILRGAIARTINAYGFIGSLGLNHHSILNAFNLADDLIEPFRPLVDLFISGMAYGEELTPAHKKQLQGLLGMSIISGGEIYSVSYAVERLVMSLAKSMEEEKNCLLLPDLCEIKEHLYE